MNTSSHESGAGRVMFQTVSLSSLRAGAVLHAPIYDPGESGTKLLGKGVAITDDLLDRLRRRGVDRVVVSERDIARLEVCRPQGESTEEPVDHIYVRSLLQTAGSQQLDRLTESTDNLTVGPQREPFTLRLRPRGNKAYDREAVNELAEKQEQRVGFVEGLFQELVSSKTADVRPIGDMCRESLTQAVQDRDLFACFGVNPYAADYPVRHSLHVAALAVSMGIEYGLDEPTLHELAMGCMLHDVGMLHLEKPYYLAKRVLTRDELREIATHPVLSFELLEPQLDRVPLGAQMVAYQMHERLNGMGYPRGRKGEHIHELAKIASVADAFSSLVTKRPHRPGLLPYRAMLKILNAVKQGYYDPEAVRALLRSVSLFPLGSFVQLNNRFVGRVLRSNPDRYDRPIVEFWSKGALDKPPTIINLLETPDLEIVRPLKKLQ